MLSDPMSKHITCLILISLLIATAHGEPLAIVGGTIIDGNGGPPVEDGVILIEGQRIIAVGTARSQSRGAPEES
jgi:imidazolonepropionase-like amidohydrolase